MTEEKSNLPEGAKMIDKKHFHLPNEKYGNPKEKNVKAKA